MKPCCHASLLAGMAALHCVAMAAFTRIKHALLNVMHAFRRHVCATHGVPISQLDLTHALSWISM
jgi:hypothetical protein